MNVKYKYLLKNMGLMTISNFTSKILSFLLVPLYTNVLSTTAYGTYDLYATTAFLLMPLFSVCISDAVLRYTLDKEKNPISVFDIGIKFYLRACFLMAALVVLNYMFGIIEVFNQYPLYFMAYYMLCMLADILTQFARGLERVSDIAAAGILSSVAMIVMNILLLVAIPLGIRGYFIANCFSFGVTVCYLVLRLKVWNYLHVGRDRELQKEMVAYSSPYIFNQLAWWINNVSDRYIVTWFCGTASNGIYSVAYKIPSLLTVFQTIFNQAWTLSAVKELDENSTDFFSHIYKMYNCGMVVLCSALIVADKIIAKLLFANEFYEAWRYAPLLLISVVFGSLSGVFAGIFSAAKDSKTIAKTTIVGASVNTILNMILVYKMGPIGAAIATLISYILVWASRLRAVDRIVKFTIELKRDLISYVILVLQAVLLLTGINHLIVQFGEVALLIMIILMYRKDVRKVLKQIVSKLKKG